MWRSAYRRSVPSVTTAQPSSGQIVLFARNNVLAAVTILMQQWKNYICGKTFQHPLGSKIDCNVFIAASDRFKKKYRDCKFYQ
jgi:hypothetical protein